MRLTCALMVVFSALAAFAPSARAVDGVVEINEAKALAGGVTPGDGAGFPVSITRPGSYRLTSDLAVSSAATDAIRISANDVTLDLNGFTISGPTVCSERGEDISCAPLGAGIGVRELPSGATTEEGRGIRVKNGTVRGMGDYGVFLYNIATIEDLTAIGNGGDGIFCVHSCTALRNRAIRNGGTGINGGNSSGPVPTGMTAIHNVSNGNGGLGIAAGSGSVAIGNMLKQNGGRGLQGLGGFVNNVITSNAGGTVNGFTDMGGNICDGDTICP